jgi:hypothetical protein
MRHHLVQASSGCSAMGTPPGGARIVDEDRSHRAKRSVLPLLDQPWIMDQFVKLFDLVHFALAINFESQ